MPTTRTTTATSGTADAVLAALAEGPASAADIAETVGIGRSTATKALAGLAAEGKVERSAGGRHGARRLPDRWSLPAATVAPEPAGEPAEDGRSAARLGKGELAGLVLTFLRDNPGDHTPTAVAKALDGRSSGAVGNALVRLVGVGDATQTSQAPRRYQVASR